ncbi:MAG TPA: hypothetical protein VH639_18010 [Bryobacteraceae bacterium]|jgi:hypothetical protein
MSIFERGQLDDIADRGWVLGNFAGGPRQTGAVEVKWTRHAPGLTGKGWSDCYTATTLSVLISGKFRILFRNAPVEFVDLSAPGDYVLFGPGIPHLSRALEDSLLITVRWPSVKGDCHLIEHDLS